MKAGGELSNLLNKEFKILFRDFQKFPLRCCAIMRERQSAFHLFFSRRTIVNTDFKNLQSLKIMRLSVTQSVYPVCGRWRERGGSAGEVLLPSSGKPKLLACAGGW